MAQSRNISPASQTFLDQLFQKNLDAFTISSASSSPALSATDRRKEKTITSRATSASPSIRLNDPPKGESSNSTAPPTMPLVNSIEQRTEEANTILASSASPLTRRNAVQLDPSTLAPVSLLTPLTKPLGSKEKLLEIETPNVIQTKNEAPRNAPDSYPEPPSQVSRPNTTLTALPPHLRHSPVVGNSQKPVPHHLSNTENVKRPSPPAFRQNSLERSPSTLPYSHPLDSPLSSGTAAPPPTPENQPSPVPQSLKAYGFDASSLSTLQASIHRPMIQGLPTNRQTLASVASVAPPRSQQTMAPDASVASSANQFAVPPQTPEAPPHAPVLPKSKETSTWDSMLDSTSSLNLMDRRDLDTEGLHFKAWPIPMQRQTSAAQVRRVHLRNLPSTSTPYTILSLVTHGQIEALLYTPPSTSATVYFVNPDDCKAYYQATANGIPLKNSPSNEKEHVVFVELATEADPINGKLRELLDGGATRCVRAVGVKWNWDVAHLQTYARMRRRKVESVEVDKTFSGTRIAIFRFCTIQDAARFRGAVERDVDWESCNVHYAPDP
ncbi:MAG: hypothetical protein M1837_002338 [Sclerophora amabilis]|nr:MAG: hypothetical protein M1837_002338 [Sclerophora amabilis]